MAKYFVILSLRILDHDEDSSSTERTMRYTVDCNPDELGNVVEDKRSTWERNGNLVCNKEDCGRYSAEVTVKQVVPL